MLSSSPSKITDLAIPGASLRPADLGHPQNCETRGVRHRAKLVGLRSNVKCQVRAVLAGAGVAVPMSDLFG